MNSTAAADAARRWKALVCPQAKYERARIEKCCPFGEQMVYPPLDADRDGRRRKHFQDTLLAF